MTDLDRLRQEYAERERRFVNDDRYSSSNVSYRFMKLQLRNYTIKLLSQSGYTDLSSYRFLEIGCGNGNILMDFHSLDVPEKHLYGIDLLSDRLQQAHTDYPLFPLACCDAQQLPFPADLFEIVLQFTALSSILDDNIKKNVAAEMCRVAKPDGLIIWYDFWLNPTNPQTRGIRPAEIRRLFPNCKYQFYRVTLAPPLTRKLAPISWGLCLFLESLKIFNTHYLVAIRPI